MRGTRLAVGLVLAIASIAFAQTRPATNAVATLNPPGIADATLVTLKLSAADADSAIAELSKQSGYELKPYNDVGWKQATLGAVTLSLDKQPFWAAFLQMGTQAGFALMQNDAALNGRRLTLYPFNQGGQDASKYPTFISGAFLIHATGIQRTSTVEFAKAKAINRNVNMQIQVYSEPKVHVLKMSYTPEIMEAMDNRGNSLIVPGQSNSSSGNMQIGGGITWGVGIALQYPSQNPGDKIAILRGRFRTVVQTHSETMEIPDILTAKEQTKTIGGRRVVFKSFKKQNDRQYQAEVTIYRDEMEQEEFNRLSDSFAIRLMDSSGNAFWSNGGGSSSTGKEASRQVLFYKRTREEGGTNLGEPFKLALDIPTASREVMIPFEFANLPLP